MAFLKALAYIAIYPTDGSFSIWPEGEAYTDWDKSRYESWEQYADLLHKLFCLRLSITETHEMLSDRSDLYYEVLRTALRSRVSLEETQTALRLAEGLLEGSQATAERFQDMLGASQKALRIAEADLRETKASLREIAGTLAQYSEWEY